MRSLILVLLPLLLHSCVIARTRDPSETPKTAKQALMNGVGMFDGQSKVLPADALADLEDFASEGSLKEKELIGELTPVLERLGQKDAKVDQSDYRTVLSVMDRMTLLYPDDFDLQLRLTQAMHGVEKALGQDSGGSGLANARLLTSKFPNQARAHALLGVLTVDVDGAPEEAMRAFARCLELDPSELKCKEGLKTTAAAYQRPRCSSFKKEAFGLHAATDRAPGKGKAKTARRQVKVGGQTYFMERSPAVSGTDVDEVFESGAGQDKKIEVTLSPRGSARFAEITGRLAQEQAFLVIMVGGKPQSAPKVMSAIETGKFLLSGEGFDMKKLCKKMETPKLPPDVAKAYEAIK